MNNPDLPSHPPDSLKPDCEEILQKLHALAPAPLPPSLHARLAAPPPLRAPAPAFQTAPRRTQRWLLPLAAAIALTTALALRDTKRAPERPQTDSSNTPLSENAPGDTPPSASISHLRKLLRAEKAGTTASEEGAYQIVKFTVLHQAWDTSREESPRMLAETTAEEFVALPLEVF
jgi:hypothetical protein